MMDIIGRFTATPICKDKDGNLIPLSEFKGKKPRVIKKNNLVVSQGRKKIAELIGGRNQLGEEGHSANYINRLILGVGDKEGNTPHLMNDQSTFEQIQKIDSTPMGIFQIEKADIFYPDSSGKIPEGLDSGWSDTTGILDASGTFTDNNADFSTIEILDHLTLNISNTTRLVVTDVISDTELAVYNPGGLAVESSYRIDTPGTQVIFSKLIEGNLFHPDEFGPSVLVTEAGLLFNDSSLFNRVIFGDPTTDNGIVLQSDESLGSQELSYIFEFTITL